MLCLYGFPCPVILSRILSYLFHLIRLLLELLKTSISFSYALFTPWICYAKKKKVAYNTSNMFTYFQVSQFLSRQKQTKKYILVHCTHGHNRTGYMIVHYLMRSQSMSVTQVSCVLMLTLFELSLYWLLWATVFSLKFSALSCRQ